MSAKRDEASRELDARIAVEVMGWTLTAPVLDGCDHAVGTSRNGSSAKRNFVRDATGKERVIPLFSTEVAAAWLVVEKLTGFVSGRDEPWWSVAIFNAQQGQVGCRVYACQPGSNIFDVGTAHALPGDDERIIAEAVASSAPHAICLAALAALSERAS